MSQSMLTIFPGLSSTIPIERWILDNLTFDRSYHLGSTASRLVSNLSTFFMFHLLLTDHRELALQLAKYYQEVQAASSAIQTLTSFCSRRGSLGDGVYQRDNGLGPAAPLLSELGISMPTDMREAKDALAQVINHQRHLLSVGFFVIDTAPTHDVLISVIWVSSACLTSAVKSWQYLSAI